MGRRNKARLEELTLLESAVAVWFNIRRRAKKTLAASNVDLTIEQLIVLDVVTGEEGISIKELADISDRDRTTTSRMIDGLERRNLVVRVTDRQDARKKLLYPTQAAKDKLQVLEPFLEEMTAVAHKDIPVEEWTAARETLHKILRNIDTNLFRR